jgi:titin
VDIAYGSNNTIGGLEPGAGNVIAFNGTGVTVSVKPGRGVPESYQNRILSNSIYANTELGIDLASDGRTANDPMDPDNGPNHLQNSPVITSAQITNNAVTIQGTLNSQPNMQFTIQYFAEAKSLSRPVQTYLGSTSTTTDANGNATFSAGFGLQDSKVTFNITAPPARSHPLYSRSIHYGSKPPCHYCPQFGHREANQ